MEGLIPLVLKSMKRSKTLKQYQSLSGVHSDHDHHQNSLIDVDDFYHPEEGYIDYHYHYQLSAPTGPQENARGGFNGRQGRSKSFNYDRNTNVFKPRQQKQLVRFRSTHNWLSCVSGA